jgi:regulator of sigma E protease
MELLFGIILGLFILVFLVVVHELGHAIVARRNGVVVEEFGIGFPPRAWKKKLRNGVLFTLNWLPLGGFVKLQGEHDSASKKGDYGAASFWQKTRILLAGVGINWLVAAGLFTILAWTGLPKILPDQFSMAADTKVTKQPVEIATLEEGYPAAQAGIEVGDTIVRFAGEEVPTTERFVELTKEHKGDTVDVIYTRDGVEATEQVMLRDAEDGGLFGAGLNQREMFQSTWSAPIVGVGTTFQFTWVTLQELGKLLAGVVSGFFLQFSFDESTRTAANATLNQAGQSVAGPIGILGVIFPAAGQAGLTQVIFLTAIISLTLAVMNALPIPALDGGRWFVTALFRLIKMPLTKEREEKIQGTGFMILMGLVILVTITDVSKLF